MEGQRVTREQLKEALLERYTGEMYEAVSSARIAIAGLGGLGSNVAAMLARAGVGELLLVDFDRVELTNLNRQMYTVSHLGKDKTEAMTEILKEINPWITLKTGKCRVTQDNVTELFAGYPIVCEAFDQPENKAMLVNALLENSADTIVVSGSGMAGIGSGNTIRTKRSMRRLYLCGDGTTELQEGVCLMASRVNLCAAHQANMILRLILGMTDV